MYGQGLINVGDTIIARHYVSIKLYKKKRAVRGGDENNPPNVSHIPGNV